MKPVFSIKRLIPVFALAMICGWFHDAAQASTTSDHSGSAMDDDFVRVQIRGTLRTGLMAIGGETTGTTITADGITWELDCTGNREIMAALERLNGKTVFVQGKLELKKGVEIRQRWIVHVEGLSTKNFFEKNKKSEGKEKAKTRLEFPIILRDAQGGFAGFSGQQLTIEKDGNWKREPFLNENLRDATAKGKLSEKQMASLANWFAENKITDLPKELGTPIGANPRVVTITVGKYQCKMTLPPGATDTSQLKGKRENEKKLLSAVEKLNELAR